MTKKAKKIRYIHETYTDEFRTLFQAIEIDVKLDKESKGCHSKNVRRICFRGFICWP